MELTIHTQADSYSIFTCWKPEGFQVSTLSKVLLDHSYMNNIETINYNDNKFTSLSVSMVLISEFNEFMQFYLV